MREVIVRLRDDLDHSLKSVETVEFAYRGTAYEIDLGGPNAAEFDEVMARYISAGRKVKRSHKRRQKIPVNGEAVTVKSVPPSDDDGKELRRRIREYARSQGIEQSNVGLIKRESLETFYAAHPEEATG